MKRGSELERIAALAATFAAETPGVRVGIGDDAAVLEVQGDPRAQKLVWTIDEQVEGTHFRRDLLGWEDIGWRSFMAAASDLAAMGALPWCALSALALPADVDDAALAAIAEGQRAAARAVGCAIVGGNLSRSEAVSLTTTLLGTCIRPVERRGALAGDGIWLAGPVGLAAAGLRALDDDVHDPAVAHAVSAWRRPTARIREGLAMAPRAHAAIDVSDGLAQDVGHVARASGVRAVIDEAALREDAELARAAAALGVDPVALALDGGEDYAIVAASDGDIEGFRRIGEFRVGAGVALRGATEREITPRGFDHFRS